MHCHCPIQEDNAIDYLIGDKSEVHSFILCDLRRARVYKFWGARQCAASGFGTLIPNIKGVKSVAPELTGMEMCLVVFCFSRSSSSRVFQTQLSLTCLLCQDY